MLISHDSPCEAMLPSTLIGVDCDPAYSYLPGTGQAINIGIVYILLYSHDCVVKLTTYILYIMCLLIHNSTYIQNILYKIHVNLRLHAVTIIYIDTLIIIYVCI